MQLAALLKTAQTLVASDKGLLAMDESTGTCDLRFAGAGIAQTVQNRRDYRELLATAPGLSESVSGAILFDETIRQSAADGRGFVQVLSDAGIVAGIKVDTGAKALAAHPGERVTEGLDGLRERLAGYSAMGARFAKWRAVIAVGGNSAGAPSRGCIDANTHALARYAALCQEAALVPIVEPEVLMDGDHTMHRCLDVTDAVLRSLFEQLARQRVVLEGLILKPNMVVAGTDCATQPTVDEVADATLLCLRRVVPAAVAGIAFLSGGQSAALACARLNAMHVRHRISGAQGLPWPLTFSFARALQHPSLNIWAGVAGNRAAAQRALVHRAACSRAAVRGQYDGDLESS
jgi:fructose-bisphosphate aldolase class I